jgi:hypothetical protein
VKFRSNESDARRHCTSFNLISLTRRLEHKALPLLFLSLSLVAHLTKYSSIENLLRLVVHRMFWTVHSFQSTKRCCECRVLHSSREIGFQRERERERIRERENCGRQRGRERERKKERRKRSLRSRTSQHSLTIGSRSDLLFFLTESFHFLSLVRGEPVKRLSTSKPVVSRGKSPLSH